MMIDLIFLYQPVNYIQLSHMSNTMEYNVTKRKGIKWNEMNCYELELNQIETNDTECNKMNKTKWIKHSI